MDALRPFKKGGMWGAALNAAGRRATLAARNAALNAARRERVLACLIFGDGEPGDQKVLYVHGWNQDCSVIRLLNPRQISRSTRLHPRGGVA